MENRSLDNLIKLCDKIEETKAKLHDNIVEVLKDSSLPLEKRLHLVSNGLIGVNLVDLDDIKSNLKYEILDSATLWAINKVMTQACFKHTIIDIRAFYNNINSIMVNSSLYSDIIDDIYSKVINKSLVHKSIIKVINNLLAVGANSIYCKKDNETSNSYKKRLKYA